MFCCCCGSCGCGCGCGCGCDSDNVTTLPIFPDTPAYPGPTAQFPVYVSYPAFYAGETAINGANQAIFTVNGTTPVARRAFYRV